MKVLTHEYQEVMALIADLHVGSVYGLNHPEYRDLLGGSYSINKCQEKLWEYWLDFKSKCEEFEVDKVLIVGDLIAGVNPIAVSYTHLTMPTKA